MFFDPSTVCVLGSFFCIHGELNSEEVKYEEGRLFKVCD